MPIDKSLTIVKEYTIQIDVEIPRVCGWSCDYLPKQIDSVCKLYERTLDIYEGRGYIRCRNCLKEFGIE